MAVDVRKGFHGDILYAFEDSDSFDQTGSLTTDSGDPNKTFGSNTTMDTFDGGRQAERKYNASRTAAEIIAQNFDGGWGVTFELGAVPAWWLATILGDPSTSNPVGSQYEHSYSLSNDNDPRSLRLYAPTDGFSNYYVVPGCWVVSANIDQSQDGSPEVNLSGGFASEPYEDSTHSFDSVSFDDSTFSNRDAEVIVDGNTVGRSQDSSVTLETGTEGKSEIGTNTMVDFVPGAFEPEMTIDHITWVNQTVDFHQRFIDQNQATVEINWDNGETGDAKRAVEVDLKSSYSNEWTESNRNDPDADLLEELTEMAQDADVLLVNNVSSPPGA
jgi:hypothetical protein